MTACMKQMNPLIFGFNGSGAALGKSTYLFYEKMNGRDESFNLSISKKDIASFIGTTPESVSRKLLSFVSQKLIQINGRRRIKILELDQLKGIAEMN